jgi:hypothetical protein
LGPAGAATAPKAQIGGVLGQFAKLILVEGSDIDDPGQEAEAGFSVD